MTSVEDACGYSECGKTGKLTKGYCQTHYYNLKRKGLLPGKKCEVDDCETGVMARGKCSTHYNQDRRAGLHGAPKCSVETCEKVSMANGLCGTHDWRRERGLDLDAPVRGAGPWQEWEVTSKGYVRRRRTTPEGKREWQWEHRIVMEEIVGRPLERHEEVHHRNGDRADNSPENLQLWSTKQPKGQHWVDKLQYAREIIALYEPLEQSGFDDGECAPRD